MKPCMWVVALTLSQSVAALPRISPDAGAPSAAPAPSARQRAQEILDAALSSKDFDLRTEAVSALGVARVPQARPELLKLLKDPDGKLRFHAARGLTALADSTTAPDVIEAFRKEDGWAVKKELAAAAVTTGAKELVPELRTASLDPRQELAAAAAWALTDFKDPAGDAALTRLGKPARKNTFKEGSDRWARKVLNGKTEGDTKLATFTLAHHGKPEDAALLERGLTSVDPNIRLWSAAGVLRFTTP